MKCLKLKSIKYNHKKIIIYKLIKYIIWFVNNSLNLSSFYKNNKIFGEFVSWP